MAADRPAFRDLGELIEQAVATYTPKFVTHSRWSSIGMLSVSAENSARSAMREVGVAWVSKHDATPVSARIEFAGRQTDRQTHIHAEQWWALDNEKVGTKSLTH